MQPTVHPLPQRHQVVVDQFVAVCQEDAWVVAAFLGGSYAAGTADAYSDLDLGLITTDAAFEDACAGRATFIRRLGDPVFLEDFGLRSNVFFIFPDGTEGELALGCVSQFQHMHRGPYRVLYDPAATLAGAVFAGSTPAPAEQRETLRRLIVWFWHDLSHLITALGRGQLWWAYGQLEVLRGMCVNLARLRHNAAAAADGYDKVEQALPEAQLAPLHATCCPQERGAMLQAARAIVGYYLELAPHLAHAHGLAYPVRLERVMVERLDTVCWAL